MTIYTYYYCEPSCTNSDAQASANKCGRAISPRVDLHESKEKNIATATIELPGVKKEDVVIDLQHNPDRLVVSGHTAAPDALDEAGYALRERRFGRFERVLALPVGTKPEDVKAEMDNGVLTVTFPRTQPEQEAQRVAIL